MRIKQKGMVWVIGGEFARKGQDAVEGGMRGEKGREWTMMRMCRQNQGQHESMSEEIRRRGRIESMRPEVTYPTRKLGSKLILISAYRFYHYVS